MIRWLLAKLFGGRVAACRRCGRSAAEHKPQFTDDADWIDAGCPEDICHTYLPGWKRWEKLV